MIYAKTEVGQKAFRERSALFSARQRAAFIMFDGVKPSAQILESTTGLGVTSLDIEHMVAQGCLIEVVASGSPGGAMAAPSQPIPTSARAPSPVAASAQAPAPVQTPSLTSVSDTVPTLASSVPPPNQRTPQERYSRAKPLATQLTASLGLRGFLLNLGVESASGYDDLLALLPKIQAAVGAKKCAELERVLKG